MEAKQCECGSSPYTQEGVDNGGKVVAFVVCGSCHEQTDEYSTLDKAIAAWNSGDTF